MASVWDYLLGTNKKKKKKKKADRVKLKPLDKSDKTEPFVKEAKITPESEESKFDARPVLSAPREGSESTSDKFDPYRPRLAPPVENEEVETEDGEGAGSSIVERDPLKELRQKRDDLLTKPIEDKDSKIMNFFKEGAYGMSQAYTQAKASGATNEEAFYASLGGFGTSGSLGAFTKEGGKAWERREREADLRNVNQKLYPLEAQKDLTRRRAIQERGLDLDAEVLAESKRRTTLQSKDRQTAETGKTERHSATTYVKQQQILAGLFKDNQVFKVGSPEYEAFQKQMSLYGLPVYEKGSKKEVKIDHDQKTGLMYTITTNPDDGTTTREALMDKATGKQARSTSKAMLADETKVSEGAKDRSHREKLVSLKSQADQEKALLQSHLRQIEADQNSDPAEKEAKKKQAREAHEAKMRKLGLEADKIEREILDGQ
jgi:hypothetical protein